MKVAFSMKPTRKYCRFPSIHNCNFDSLSTANALEPSGIDNMVQTNIIHIPTKERRKWTKFESNVVLLTYEPNPQRKNAAARKHCKQQKITAGSSSFEEMLGITKQSARSHRLTSRYIASVQSGNNRKRIFHEAVQFHLRIEMCGRKSMERGCI